MANPDLIFRALADETRRRTLTVLKQHELSVSELVSVLDQPESTVSRHLRVLRDATLIVDRRNGNAVMYSVPSSGSLGGDLDPLGGLTEWLGRQALPRSIKGRLDAVLHKRGDMSRRFFNAQGSRWDTLREESFGSRFELEAFMALLPDNWTVADIGSGTGYLLPVLARHFRRVIGVEPAGRMIAAATERVEREGLKNVELRTGELEELPISRGSVDLALAVLVLHHVASPASAVSELRRISRKGGAVLLVEQYAHQNESFRTRMQDRLWGFDPAELVAWLEAAGFTECRSVKLGTAELADDAPELFAVTARCTQN